MCIQYRHKQVAGRCEWAQVKAKWRWEKAQIGRVNGHKWVQVEATNKQVQMSANKGQMKGTRTNKQGEWPQTSANGGQMEAKRANNQVGTNEQEQAHKQAQMKAKWRWEQAQIVCIN